MGFNSAFKGLKLPCHLFVMHILFVSGSSVPLTKFCILPCLPFITSIGVNNYATATAAIIHC